LDLYLKKNLINTFMKQFKTFLHEEPCPDCGRTNCSQKLTERYNTGTDQFLKIQSAMRTISDFMVSLDRDENAPDVKRNKRKLKNLGKIWKDIEQSLGPRYVPSDYPHKTRVTHRQKKLGMGVPDYSDDLWG
tara:strand:+ start:1329 stop:1724 length:396 start_codon:yes stop_codon:yes gene_type:complete